ncbi:MAG: hypothetical protein PHF46_03585 [Candidatus Gracilibacteria bacterium]|nr:hypothetical protein [Candidatus Gracilibacteria bacterium]
MKKQKVDIEQSKVNLTKKFAKDLIGEEIYKDTLQDLENDIKDIDKAIEDFSDDTDVEMYLVRLPEILSKTFELARKSIDKEKIEDMKDDLLKLIELTTFELTVTNKKELKIQLFDVLDGLISNDKSILEAPPWRINTKIMGIK